MKWMLFRRCGLQPYNYAVAPRRNFGRFAYLGFALSCALAAALLASSFLDSRLDERKVAEARPQLETVEVLVAAADITLGQGLANTSVKWQKWLKDSLPAGVITRQAQPDARAGLDGAMARVSLMAGEPVFESKIVRNYAGGLMSLMLPSGMRAVSMKISPETGAGGFILPNDRVDVILTRSKASEAGGTPDFQSETVLRGARVLAIDQTVESQGGKAKGVALGKTATLELVPRQAEILARAAAAGSLSLALRSHADGAPEVRNGEQNDVYAVVVHRPGKEMITTERYSFSGPDARSAGTRVSPPARNAAARIAGPL